MNLEGLGKLILYVGVSLVVLGGVIFLLGRLGIGRIPGDIVWRGKHVTVYLPIGLSILLSIIATIVLNLLFRR